MASKSRLYLLSKLAAARMPASSTATWRCVRRRTISSRAWRVSWGSMPRSMSLAPSSRMTASVPSGTDQSRRASPPEAVSPDTPALVTSTARPLALRARSSFAGKAPSAGRPKPAVSESPNATIRTGRSAAAAAGARAGSASANAVASSATAWTGAAQLAYDRSNAGRPRIKGSNEQRNMQDASGSEHEQLAIALSGVNLALGRAAARVHILKDLDLHIRRGEALGLVGPSGSGKSTLLMVAAGLERADTGSVVVAGKALGPLGEDALARFRGRNIGIVFQSFHLIPTMTALENVAVPLELAGLDDAHARAARELAAVGLSERRGHYPAELSGGEQQRVALARALAPNPAILLADEPTGNLDEATGAQIIDLLFAGHEQRGTTLVLVTHDPALAVRCDRIVRLRSGRIETVRERAAAEAKS